MYYLTLFPYEKLQTEDVQEMDCHWTWRGNAFRVI